MSAATDPTMVEAALAYARQGWRVLPLHSPRGTGCSCEKTTCVSPAKHPRTLNGFKDASNDPAVLEAWWKRWPDANVGVRTGEVSGIVVVDVDSYHDGDAGLADLEAEHGALPATLTADTGGGGHHLVFAHPRNREVRNKAGMAKGVDLRADGGYVVVPPSVHISGRAYGWQRPLQELAALPQWLTEPKREERATVTPLRSYIAPSGDRHPWATAALEGEVRELRRAQEGTRNHQLNRSAYNLGQLVPHALEQREVEDELRHVALGIGLTEAEIGPTMASGLEDGKAVPRDIPERPLKPRTRPQTGLHGSEDAEPERPRVLSLRWVTDAYAAPPAEPRTLVDGMLRAGELCVLGAPRALGKSWFAMNLAVLLGRGEGKVGGQLTVHWPCKVLYAQGELDEWESFDRWTKLCGARAVEGVAESFDRWRLRVVRRRSMSSGRDGEGNWSESDEYVEAVLDGRLEATVVANDIDVLIIDPWAVYFAGAENSNDEVEAGLDKLRLLAMTHGLAVVILHHLGKGTDAREPEDLWRGASRLADWASTRITMLPHYTETQARDQGMTRRQARRYVDLRFLRRSKPTDDFSMNLNDDGWWKWWASPQDFADSRRVHIEPIDVGTACAEAGGWEGMAAVRAALQISAGKATEVVEAALRDHFLEEIEPGRRGARRFVPGSAMRQNEEF